MPVSAYIQMFLLSILPSNSADHPYPTVEPQTPQQIIEWFVGKCIEYQRADCLERYAYLGSVSFKPQPEVAAMCYNKDSTAIGCAYTGFPIAGIRRYPLDIAIADKFSPMDRFPEMREILIHELGHALLGASHTTEEQIDFMYPTVSVAYTPTILQRNGCNSYPPRDTELLPNNICVERTLLEPLSSMCNSERVKVLFGQPIALTRACDAFRASVAFRESNGQY